MQAEESSHAERKWHEGPNLTYGLIIAMLVHAFAVVWWASDMTSRVNKLENHIADTRSIPTDIARLQENVMTIRETMTEIKVLLRAHTPLLPTKP